MSKKDMNEEPDLITTVDDINANIGKNAYILVIDEILIGSTRKSDLNKYLGDDKALIDIDDYHPEGTVLLYGLILDPIELPYELPKELEGNDIWLIESQYSGALMGLVECERYSDIESATEAIELKMKGDANLDIENFAVIAGQEMHLVFQIGLKTFSVEAKYLF